MLKKAREIIEKNGLDKELTKNKDVEKLIEELNVFHIELQVQHEELMQAQEQMYESRKKYYELYNSVPVGLMLLNKDLQIIEINKVVPVMLGCAPGELYRKKITKFIHPSDQDDFYLKSRKLLKNSSNETCEIRFVRKDKSEFFGRMSCYADHENGDLNINVSLEEITKQKEAEEKLIKALKHSKKKEMEVSELLAATHTILNTSDFKVVARKVFDACARVIGAKAGYVALLTEEGLENELLFLESGGMECTVDENLPMPVRGLRAEAYNFGKVVYDNEFMKNRFAELLPDGHMDLPNVLLTPLNIDGETLGIMGFAYKKDGFNDEDVRLAGAFGDYAAIALKNSRTLEELENRADKLHELNKTKDRLFSIIGHDLKNPLNSIIGFADVLNDEYEKADKKKIGKYTGTILKSAESLAELLDQLIQWSYSQRDSIKIEKEEFGLREIINRCIDVFKVSLNKKNIKLISRVTSGDVVYADRESVTTIIRNLISNAIKYTHREGNIWIDCENTKENLIQIRITDNGIGMSSQQIQNLFDLDKAFSGKGTEGEKGTGLGLLICSDFVKMNNGYIKVESKKGKGTSFIVGLPSAALGQ